MKCLETCITSYFVSCYRCFALVASRLLRSFCSDALLNVKISKKYSGSLDLGGLNKMFLKYTPERLQAQNLAHLEKTLMIPFSLVDFVAKHYW